MPRPKLPDDQKMEQLNVRMPRDMADQLKRRAEAEDRTLAHTVRRAVKQYLNAAAI